MGSNTLQFKYEHPACKAEYNHCSYGNLKKTKKKSKNTDKCDSIEQRKKVPLSLANVQNVQEKGIDNVTCALLFTVD